MLSISCSCGGELISIVLIDLTRKHFFQTCISCPTCLNMHFHEDFAPHKEAGYIIMESPQNLEQLIGEGYTDKVDAPKIAGTFIEGVEPKRVFG